MDSAAVMIAVPTRGSVRWETAMRLQEVRDHDPALPPVLYQPGNLSVALTRNRIVQQFLQTDCKYLAMVDDDIAPPVNFVDLLLPCMDDFAMVSLPHAHPYPGDPSLLSFSVYDLVFPGGSLLRTKDVFVGLNECDAVATGCVLISRESLIQLGPHPFRMEHDPTATIQSDDMLFCADLRTAGFKIGALWMGLPVEHYNTVNLTPLWVTANLERST